MNFQVIKSTSGNDEYVLLPISIYNEIKEEIDEFVNVDVNINNDYVTFEPEDYVKNPVILARIKANFKPAKIAG